jgi:ankyrin repeat protein
MPDQEEDPRPVQFRKISAFFNGAKEGRLDFVRDYLYWNPEAIRASTPAGTTAVHFAINEGRFETALLLLSTANVDPLAVDEDGDGPFHHAVHGKHPNLMPLIASKGGDVNAQNRAGQSSLHLAVSYRDAASVDMLLRISGILPNLRDSSGRTALHQAVTRLSPCSSPQNNETVNSPEEELRLLQQLLAHEGCDPRARDARGATPLHAAIIANNLEAVKRLLRKWPDLAMVLDGFGRSSLHLAIELNREHIALAIIDEFCADVSVPFSAGLNGVGSGSASLCPTGSSSLVMAVTAEMPYLVERLVENGATMRYQTPGEDAGDSALHRCFQRLLAPGTVTPETLLEARARICSVDMDMAQLLEATAGNRPTAIAAFLLLHGAPYFGLSNSQGRSPADLARNYPALEVLVEHCHECYQRTTTTREPGDPQIVDSSAVALTNFRRINNILASSSTSMSCNAGHATQTIVSGGSNHQLDSVNGNNISNNISNTVSSNNSTTMPVTSINISFHPCSHRAAVPTRGATHAERLAQVETLTHCCVCKQPVDAVFQLDRSSDLAESSATLGVVPGFLARTAGVCTGSGTTLVSTIAATSNNSILACPSLASRRIQNQRISFDYGSARPMRSSSYYRNDFETRDAGRPRSTASVLPAMPVQGPQNQIESLSPSSLATRSLMVQSGFGCSHRTTDTVPSSSTFHSRQTSQSAVVSLPTTPATSTYPAGPHQASLSEDDRTCNICMEKRKDAAFFCGHTACETCARQIVATSNRCHMCQQTIMGVICPVYL